MQEAAFRIHVHTHIDPHNSRAEFRQSLRSILFMIRCVSKEEELLATQTEQEV